MSDAAQPSVQPSLQALLAVLQGNFPTLDWQQDAALLARLQRLIPSRRLARGSSLFRQGAPTQAFYAVGQGQMEARFTGADGTVSVLETMQAPRLFGLAAFAAGQPSSYEAVALQPSQVWVLAEPAYCLLMDEVPGFARALLREFAQRFDGTLRMLEASRHRSAAERLQLALTQLSREQPAASMRQNGPAQEPGWLRIQTTQADLAALANLSRQTVNQLLGEAAAQGQLRRAYGQLWLRAQQA
ncbi:Crp/Fnr family transcriptional regulator [Roseateles sp. PN1]|uniref:Crp/Fnr family transcriptional regulator n=1 Tax=Roseateles sp. PN1 TaxID=3137372 RepID=UPI003139EBD1